MSSMIKTTVVQRNIGNPMQAQVIFDEQNADGSLPIVLIPSWPVFCHTALNVPSGVFVLYQHWQKHMGILRPGMIWCWPASYRISHIVTKATRTYNAPVKSCPTRDNVMVDVDLSLTFQIGPDEEAPYKFVYHMGATRFDEFLSAQTDEAIRGLVHSVTHDKVHDLHEDLASGMTRSLNAKLNPYGVRIMSVKITNVVLPANLARTLQNTTAFKTKMEEQEKAHENARREMLDNATQQVTAIRRSNERRVQDLQASVARAEIEREEQELKCQGDLEVAQMRAESKAEVLKTRAEGEKAVAAAQGQRRAEELKMATRTECTAAKIAAEQAARTRVVESEAKLEAASNIARAKLADARAEEKVSRHMVEERRFQLEQKRLTVMAELAESGRLVIGGDTGEQLLQSLCPGSASAISLS